MKLNYLFQIQRDTVQLRNIIFMGLLSIILLSGCVRISGKEDVATRLSLPKVDNQFQPTIVWSHSIGNGFDNFYSNLHPAWMDTRIFAADRQGLVKALNAESGQEIWSKDLSIYTGFFSRNRSAQLSGGIMAAGNRIYLSSELAKVYALNAQDGSLVWERTVAGEALSTPVVSDDILLIHTSNGMLQALNEIDGAVKWTVNLNTSPLTLRGESTPTIAFGAAIIGDDHGFISAVMINQGQLIWRQRIAKPNGATEITRIHDIDMTPIVVNDVVYAIAYNGNLAALELHSGQVIWSQKIGSVNNLIVKDERIYLVDKNDQVIAINTQSGMILWCQSDLLHRHLTSPVLHNGYIATGDAEGYLHWINTNDGRFVAQQKVDVSGLLSDPIVARNQLIIQAKNGKIYAITH